MKEFATQILNVSAIAHGEDVQWLVSGFDDFLDAGLTEDLADFTGVTTANIPSPTFKKAVAKHLVVMAAKSMDLDSQAVIKSLDEVDAAKPEDFVPQQAAQNVGG